MTEDHKPNPLEEYQRKLAAGEIEAPKPKNHIEKWKERNTRASAINANCVICVGGTLEDVTGTREMIRECTDMGCPLREWRPYK